MKLLITGYFGAGNFGDDMMLQAFCKEMKSVNPNVEITILKLYEKPFNIELDDSIKVINMYKIPRGKKYLFKFFIKKYDMFLWIGGTCFTDQDGDGCYIYMKPALEKGVKIGYIGVGIGKLTLEERINKTKYLINKCDFITFRDEKSFNYAKKINKECRNLRLTEDLAYLFVEDIEFNDNIFKEKDEKRKVIISWRNLVGYVDEVEEMRLINKLIEFIYELMKENINTEFVILPLDDRKDIEKNNIIYEELKKYENKSISVKFKKNLTPIEKINEIINSNLNISGRLHGIFVSEISNIQTIAISYSIKIDEFLKSIDKECDLIDVRSIDKNKLKSIYKLNKKLLNECKIEENLRKSKKNIYELNNFIKKL